MQVCRQSIRRIVVGPEHDLLDQRRLLSVERLEDGVVLGIHRQYLGSGGRSALHYDFACYHKGFFVGKGYFLPGIYRSQNRLQSGNANYSTQHRIHFRVLHCICQSTHAILHGDAGAV